MPDNTDQFGQRLPSTAITLPMLGDAAYVRVNGLAAEAIENWTVEHAGKDSAPWEVALYRLTVMDRAFISFMLDHCLTGATSGEALDGMPLSELAERLQDAVCFMLYGRRYQDQVDHVAAAQLAAMAKLKAEREAYHVD